MIKCIQDGDGYAVSIGGKNIIVRDVDALCIWAECSLDDLGDETGADFPWDLNIDVMFGNDLESVPFRRVALFKQGATLLLECEGDGTWECPKDTNGLARLHAAIEGQVKRHGRFVAQDMSDEDAACLLIRTRVDPTKRLRDSIALAVEELIEIITDAHDSLSDLA